MSAKQADAAAEAAKKEVLFVLDANHKQGQPPRIHECPTEFDKATGEVTRTHSYKLTSDTPVEMPAEHAMKFAKDPAFIVADAEGKRIKPVRVRNLAAIGRALGLDENETVCEYEEMTKEALFKRCQTLPGGEHLKPTDDKALLIEFLKEMERIKSQLGVARGSEDVEAKFQGGALDGRLPSAVISKLVGDPKGAVAEVIRRQKVAAEKGGVAAT